MTKISTRQFVWNSDPVASVAPFSLLFAYPWLYRFTSK